MNKVKVIFTFLKIKVKIQKALDNVSFAKKCMFKIIIPKCGNAQINNDDEVVRENQDKGQ